MTTRFMLTQGIILSTLTLGLGMIACSSDSKPTPAAGTGGSGTIDDGGDGSGGKTTGTGGKTGGTGGSADTDAGTGGAKTDGGEYDSGMPMDGGEVTCAAYCADSLEYCVNGDGGDHEGYFNSEADCLAACADYPTTGATGDSSGNTIQCRMTHLGFIESAADPVAYAKIHCPHTGAHPVAFCK